MYKLINPIRSYCWGSKTDFTDLYGLPNPEQKPMAEMWMGAHPLASSRLIREQGPPVTLEQYIAESPQRRLGEKVARQYHQLPFLLKLLAAADPLSIQVHPGYAAAKRGFERENQQGIPPDAPQRNYKDANHKPELLYAITPFSGMNGFRPLSEIASLLQPLSDLHPQVARFMTSPDKVQLKQLFEYLLKLAGAQRRLLTHGLTRYAQEQTGRVWQIITDLSRLWPEDVGLFMPLLLNIVELAPGEAMFLAAETPHAYLHGTGLEIMANSDNVLRAGLTTKYRDVPELLANVCFDSRQPAEICLRPQVLAGQICFPVPVSDFSFEILTLTDQPHQLSAGSPVILFCLEGMLDCRNAKQRLVLHAGESLFAGADQRLSLRGSGTVAKASAGDMD